jgi:hypothetical protein
LSAWKTSKYLYQSISNSFDEVGQTMKERSSMNMFSGVLQVLHGLVRRKDWMMNTQLHTERQSEMAAYRQTNVTDLGDLILDGFTSEEIVSLLWLQHWYQSGGSDRVAVLRHWEFLKYLELTGTFDLHDRLPS